MSSSTSTLPPDWSNILDEVHKRLDNAIAQADARIAQAPQPNETHLEITKWSERLQRLSAYLESAEQVVHSVDEALQQEESLLRRQLAASGTLRQKLAAEAGRAIG